mgnify:CR=1 FL=1
MISEFGGLLEGKVVEGLRTYCRIVLRGWGRGGAGSAKMWIFLKILPQKIT